MKSKGSYHYMIPFIFLMSTSAYFIKPETTVLFTYEPEVEKVEMVYIPTQPTTTTTTTTTIPETINKSVSGNNLNRVLHRPTTTLPHWLGDIPEVYGEGTGCTPEQADVIANLLWEKGADDSTVRWMLMVFSRESTCTTEAYNGNRGTGDDSWGLCQLNKLAGFFNEGEILDKYIPEDFAGDFIYNANACVDLWSVCGRGPWNRGDYYCRKPSS